MARRPGGPRALTDEQVRAIARARENGVTHTTICRYLGDRGPRPGARAAAAI
ncbi:hypothetical protein [Rhodococcus coprophilus]|uniref:Uncharacterized protein n=1 Tax=Rhodococcus coprophilus TaxID=38310 RepID=A0A2X4WNS7_9NOCA|nr:hypothetical protein [Rhodococcus coprophilus]MBM7460790.1 hypothetical protein [Rhodococcus coprophilus]SQI28595.1 Uncharacterised protein [Rhodococcus coprophilus]